MSTFAEENAHGRDVHTLRTHGSLLISNTVSYNKDGVLVAEHVITETRPLSLETED
jgi:hypothetical protein